MKKLMVFLLAAALVLSLAACGGGETPSAPETQPESPFSGAEPVPEASSQEPASQPEREWDLQPGKVLPYDRPERSEERPYSWELGTEKELAEFKALLGTADISYLTACDWTDVEAELPVETELEILRALEAAQPEFFERMENPATGGTYGIGIYDREGKELLSVGYDGFWFVVSFFTEEKISNYIFNGERMNLDLPSLEKYCSDSPFFGLDPGEVISMEDERLAGPLLKGSYGTQADLDRWYSLIQTAEINRLAVCRTGAGPGELPVPIEGQIRTLLQSAQVTLYPPETKEDPVTGGGVTILAYGGEGQQLFCVTYIGSWFTVQFGEEEAKVIFNGEESEDLAFLLTIDLA